MSEPRSLRVAYDHGYNVILIMATNVVKDGEWLLLPTCCHQSFYPLDTPRLLLIPKAMVEEAMRLWPAAQVTTPNNVGYTMSVQ